ncbi:hypothetical protein [Geodermatophilus ruber]|uniref:EcsC protein family protein n=1 Tax=Geodermatophilus ruber TaxID=504800 RepID=A0A1I4EVB6_9ACTN|nr:hypothetical protein [Geodermatophilus ruber]SFL09133.1 hypothetical protein SAMN04488085_106188 [Geodermatophilus ruber]
MTERRERTGAVRDVPPPRPIGPTGRGGRPVDVAEESPLGRAGRLLADAVSGLVDGSGAAAPAGGAAQESRRPVASTLRDVVAAVRAVAGPRRRPAAGEATPDAAPPGPEEGWAPGAVLGDVLAAAVPRLPIRDRARLRTTHPGLSDDEIADVLVARAARLTAGIGAATGGLTAASWLAPASLLVLPLELGAETVLVAAVEVVLLGELHELSGRPAPGDARARATAYLASWSAQRPVDGVLLTGLADGLGAAGLRALRRRLTRRLARTVPAAAPFLIGAALGGRANRRATEVLAGRVRSALRASRA